MLKRWRDLLAAAAKPEADEESGEQQLRLCLAALLVEVSRADFDEHPDEASAILGLVGRYFQLTEAEAADLLKEARALVDDAVSLHQFTAPLHAGWSYARKLELIAMLWDVALHDRELNKYEDYLVGKLAELLYVARSDVVKLRWQALESRRQS